MLPTEARPSSGTESPTCTVAGAKNWATGASSAKPLPDATGVSESDPPALEDTFSTAGGAAVSKVAWPLLSSGPNPARLRAGASPPDSMSLDLAWIVSSSLSESYVADVTVTWSVMATVFFATGVSAVLTTSIFVPAG